MQHFALGEVVLIAEVGEMLMGAEVHTELQGHGGFPILSEDAC